MTKYGRYLHNELTIQRIWEKEILIDEEIYYLDHIIMEIYNTYLNNQNLNYKNLVLITQTAYEKETELENQKETLTDLKLWLRHRKKRFLRKNMTG